MSGGLLPSIRRRAVTFVAFVAAQLPVLCEAPPASAAECALVATGGFHAVTVVDLASGEVTAQIPVGEYPLSVALSPDRRTAYAGNTADNTVSVIDLARGEAVATIAVGAFPLELAAHPDGQRVHVTARNGAGVSVVDLASGTALTSIPTGGGPSGLAVTRDGHYGYTANFLDSTVTVLDLLEDRAITSFQVGTQPYDLALSLDEQTLYVTNITSADISVVDVATRTVRTTIPVGGFPSSVALHPSGTFAYVTDAPEGGVTVLDTVGNQVLTSFLLSPEGALQSATAAVMSTDGSTAWVTEFAFGNLFAIDTAQHRVRDFYPLGSNQAGADRLVVAELPAGCPLPPTPRLTADLPADGGAMTVDRPDALPIVATVRVDAELLGIRGKLGRTAFIEARALLGTETSAHLAGTLVHVIGNGDANCDTFRSAADVLAMARKIGDGGGAGPCGDDPNGDGIVEPSDLTAIAAALFTPGKP